jgi:hypothetical protein
MDPIPTIPTMNGATVLAVSRDIVYLRLPRELIRPDGLGPCSCPYCVAHPTEAPGWDTLAVPIKPGDHAWTVHAPDARALREGLARSEKKETPR